MKTFAFLAFAALCAAANLAAQTVATKSVRYEIDGKSFESSIVYHPDAKSPQPGILMVPNWMGPTPNAIAKAKKAAAGKYAVMVVDMYGTDVRPANGQEAGAAAGFVRSDRGLMRARAAKALEVFQAEASSIALDTGRIAAIGFCFGGGTVLEFGRSGADLDAIVSFHGDLLSPTLAADAVKTKAKVLVLHGANDPYVPQADVSTFMATMQKTPVDWQLVQYSGAVHSFTDPTADSDGARYHPLVATRAFAALHDLLGEVWPQ